MTTETPDFHSLMERLEKMETANRRLKRAGLAVLLLTCAALFMGQGRPNRTVEAEKFILRDARGRVRAELSMEASNRPTLTFRDENAWPLVSLGGGDEPFLTLHRASSKNQVTLMVNKEMYGLGLYDENIRAGLAVWKVMPALDLRDENGEGRAVLQLNSSSTPSILLIGKDKKLLWSAP